jgi:hypothetical protein
MHINEKRDQARQLFELSAFWSHKAGQAGVDGQRAVAAAWARQAAAHQRDAEFIVTAIIREVSR